MPNHVVNELIFRGVDKARQDEILKLLCNAEGVVDFDILVPTPKNIWWFSVGTRHEKAFRHTALDWARDNWGTKWNAYSHRPTERTDDTLTLRFETAWNPPYPWLAAVFNTLKCRFEHNWMSEGGGEGCGVFDWPPEGNDMKTEPWVETEPSPEMHRHLHKLQWGVEAFEDDDAA